MSPGEVGDDVQPALAFPFGTGTLIRGRYELQREVGAGGLGLVWAARHLGFEAPVALKFLRPELSDDPDAVRRFSAEARACFVLRSEHVVRVLDVDSYEGLPFFVMELLDGTDLRRVIETEGPLSAAHTVDYALQVCEALSAAHASGIIHRDIKPENLFLVKTGDNDACVKVLDFGISKVRVEYERRHPTHRDTGTQLAVGTPPYMSPEQVRASAELDVRSDIWSLGCVLYELLTGKSPFDRGTSIQCCAAVLELEPEPVSQLRAEVPAGLSAAIARCLRKDPAERYTDTAELAAALAPYGSGCFDAYPARCHALLTGDRRSVPPELTAVRDSPVPGALQPTAASMAVAMTMATATPDDVKTAAKLLLRFFSTGMRARIERPRYRRVWAALGVCLLGLLLWALWPKSQPLHVVKPSQTSSPPLIVEAEPQPLVGVSASAGAPPEPVPARVAPTLERGKAEPAPEVEEQPEQAPSVPKRRARRHAPRFATPESKRRSHSEPDVGF